jgi:uncharacterized protein
VTEILDAYCTLGTERDARLTAGELLGQMDEAGIHRAVIAPEDREIAVHNASGNRRVAEAARQSRGRFIPACTINPWFGESGCGELRRAVADGAKMLVFAPALQGFCLGDDLANDLLCVAAELRVPVYVHTGPHSFGAPTQLLMAAAEHPDTRFILGHCGSTDYAGDMPAAFHTAGANLWFELSLVRPTTAVGYANVVDRRRLIFGTCAPRNDQAGELRAFDALLPVDDYPDIYGANLTALLTEVRS